MHFFLSLFTEPLTITQDVQNQTVTMGENANFTCRARGTNISISWEIEGDEHRDCSNQDFCVRNMSISSSVTSTFTIDTSELIGNFTVRCVVNQTFGDQSDTNSSTGQLIVRPPPPSPSTSKTHTHINANVL